MKNGNIQHENKVTPEVVLAIRQGDEDAYRLAYYRYRNDLLQFLLRLTGSREESEDILQTVFIQLWENRERLDPDKNFKSYLFTICKNAALHYLRDSRRYEVSSLLPDIPYDSGEETDQEMITRETRLLIEIAVSNMPENRKAVFTLYQEGLTYEEIADRLQMTQPNVRKHIMRARNDLRELLGLIAFFLSLPPDFWPL